MQMDKQGPAEQILNFGGSGTAPIRAKYMLPSQILSGSVYCLAVEGRKPQIMPYFQIQHSSLAPSSSVDTKLNVGVQLQIFLYPKMSLSFLSSNDLMAISHSRTLPFKSVMDIELFRPPLPGRRASTTKLCMVTEQVHAICTPPKNFASNAYFRR